VDETRVAGWPLKVDNGSSEGSALRNPVFGYVTVLLHIRLRNAVKPGVAAHADNSNRQATLVRDGISIAFGKRLRYTVERLSGGLGDCRRPQIPAIGAVHINPVPKLSWTREWTMAIREICKYPDPVLRKKAVPVKSIDDDLRRLVDDMVETMYAEPGVGLAAPQIGVSLRLLVTDITVGEKPDSLIVLVNPTIVSVSGRVIDEEGCLSIPGIRAEIPRAEAVEIRGWDLEQHEVSLKGRGYLARAFQHEMDHLDGVLIWDRMSKLQREVLKNEWKRSQRDGVKG